VDLPAISSQSASHNQTSHKFTWQESSRVGDKISAKGNAFRPPRGRPGGVFLIIPAMMGKQKAAVFPDPVWAQAIKSLPPS